MKRSTSGAFWAECVLGAMSSALAALTVSLPSWIETAFGYDPDAGSGQLEWLIVAASVTVAATLFTFAWRNRVAPAH